MKTKFLIAIIGIALFNASCDRNSICIKGEGDVETRELNLSQISSVALSEAADINIIQGSEQKVTVTGEGNILDELNTQVNNGLWDVKFGRGCHKDYTLKIQMTVADLRAIKVSGSGNINVKEFSSINDLEVKISGQADVHLHQIGQLNTMNVGISGSGNIMAYDSIENVNTLDIHISGSGNVELFPFQVNQTDVSISGSGNVYTTTKNNLDVSISGSGNVYYLGNPSIQSKINGSGKVIGWK